MDLATITTDDFKAQFIRDFPYLPVYEDDKEYFIPDLVYYDDNGQFYTALADDLSGVLPTNPKSWKRTPQDADNFISDSDITRAFAEAEMSFNQGLFGSDSEITLAYLYLTAHYLVMDIRTAAAGTASAGEGILNSKAAGSVSVGYTVPTTFVNDPVLGYYYKSGYGQKYLSFLIPRITGNVVSIAGATRP